MCKYSTSNRRLTETDFKHRCLVIFFWPRETSRARSEYHEYFFYYMQTASAFIVVISGARCRPFPNFRAACETSNGELAKNRLQIRNLRTLKYRAPCPRILVDDFSMMNNEKNHVHARNPGDPPGFPLWGN